MTKEERIQILKIELEKAERSLIHGGFCASHFYSDIYELPYTKRKVQIQITVEADEYEFERPTGSFTLKC